MQEAGNTLCGEADLNTLNIGEAIVIVVVPPAPVI